MKLEGADLPDALLDPGAPRGVLVAVTVDPAGRGVGLATDQVRAWVEDDPAAVVRSVEEAIRPRWVWWSLDTPTALIEGGTRVSTCWDIAAVHRLLAGGWRADPATVWADLHGLPRDTIPAPNRAEGELILFGAEPSDDGDGDDPVRPDGHLRPGWVAGAWSEDPPRWQRWAELAMVAARLQQAARAGTGGDDGDAAVTDRWLSTARSESTAELLCAELAADGLPVDRAAAEAIIASFAGTRPTGARDATAQRRQRDQLVLRHAPAGVHADLRSPAQVKVLLRHVGIDVPDTRSWRLEAQREAHPLVDELLAWRKAERISTTYGYAWLDAHLGADGRLRGRWSGSDGAAGRMTASAGLHNMPAALRPAVIARPGFVFVRADLGQIEPRVLAAISGDRALSRATGEDDLYVPVARQLGVDRATAKVAVLGAMYGQTTGHGATAGQGLRAAYPVAMRFLDQADRDARTGRDLRTFGGRVIPMSSAGDGALPEPTARARAAARGRYGRNAVVQGAAAELFKLWAVLVRARAAPLDARIVLCLHDELLVHTPTDHGAAVAALLAELLNDAARRWAPRHQVRFVADIRVLDRWSDAKN